jgi:outer membrane protein OmpA-like peptidoglycan-associated protein
LKMQVFCQKSARRMIIINRIAKTGLIIIFSLCAQAVCADTTIYPGSYAMPLSMQNTTARAAAMGSAFTGMAQDSSALLFNPAGLGSLNGMEIGLHHNNGLGGLTQETVILGFDTGAAGGFGMYVNYINEGTFEIRNDSGSLLSGQNTASEFGGSLGWGKQLFQGFCAGISVKAAGKNLANSVYCSYDGDAGVIWDAAPFLKLGAAYINIGGKMGNIPIASGLRAGGSCSIDLGDKDSVVFALSGEGMAGGMTTLNAGIEGTGKGILSVRFGYVYDLINSGLDGLTGITAGVGIKLLDISLDYAYAPFGELGDTHRLSLTYAISYPKRKFFEDQEAERTILPITNTRVISFEAVHFEHDKADITPEAAIVMEKNILILKSMTDTEVRIAGHTSLSGGKNYNKKLSEKRAAAIKNYLIRRGVPEARLFIIGYGDTNPVAMESKPGEVNSDAAKLNRRAVFEIIQKY